MTDESAKTLAEAMNRLAAAIERATQGGSLQPGFHVFHHGRPLQGDSTYRYQDGAIGIGGVSLPRNY